MKINFHLECLELVLFVSCINTRFAQLRAGHFLPVNCIFSGKQTSCVHTLKFSVQALKLWLTEDHVNSKYGEIFTWKSSEYIFVRRNRSSPRNRKDWKVCLAAGPFNCFKKFKSFEPLPKIRFSEGCQGFQISVPSKYDWLCIFLYVSF